VVTSAPAGAVKGATTRVSVANDGSQATGGSHGTPSLSADGRYVAFASFATNRAPGDTNGQADVFVHDRASGQTAVVSKASDGTQGNGQSLEPVISGNGRYVAFATWPPT
jgi:Tol biopolymer transport system component